MSNSNKGDGNDAVDNVGMASAMRLASNKQGKCKGGKSDGNGNEEGKGKGGKAITMVTRVRGKWMGTATKRAMAAVMRVAGE